MEWTDAAKEEMDNYLGRMRSNLESSGADPQEVVEDMRRHIEEELSSFDIDIVNKQDIARILAKMGSADSAAEDDMSEPPVPEHSEVPKELGPTKTGLIIFFGIVLPAFSLLLEVITRMCASTFFDPVPTLWHALLIASVPAANTWALLVLKSKQYKYIRFLGWLAGIAFGTSLYYTITFLPFSPIAIFGLIYFGLGLIPLSPIIAFFVVGVLRRRLLNQLTLQGLNPFPGAVRCSVLVFVLIFLIDLPYTFTLVGVQMAGSDKPLTSSRGVRLLRSFGRDEVLLQSCYRGIRPIRDVFSFLYGISTKPVPINKRRAIYYRVTGRPYNAVKPPEMRGLVRGSLINPDDWDWDQGGDQVSARLRGLSLQQSRMDGVVYPDAGTSYTEWTLVFKNDSDVQREARTEIALPPGAVVSRLTLWIDGEEREAAYSGRQKVKAAYKRIVQRRRDPVLVTTTGPDQILLQCFPVPPEGGVMKTKIGITAPVTLESYEKGRLRLPRFLERNFNIKDELKHAVWFEANRSLSSVVKADSIMTEQPNDNQYALRGKLTDSELSKVFVVGVSRSSNARSAWARDHRDTKYVVKQLIEEKVAVAPKRVVLVIDGSARMKEYSDVIAKTLSQMSSEIEFAVLLASDSIEELVKINDGGAEKIQNASDAIKRAKYVGGCDNVPALIKAWDIAAEEQSSVILWLHATQPMELQESEELIQKWERRRNGPKLYDLQFGPGPNKIAKALDGLGVVNRVPYFGDMEETLENAWSLWSGSAKLFCYKRWREKGGNGRIGHEANDHLVRLGVYSEVLQLAVSRRDADKIKAIEIARSYQLVTPVSGAVVLESKEQYKEAGLKPADASDMPAVVPEPETWALMIVGLIVLVVSHRFRTRSVIEAG